MLRIIPLALRNVVRRNRRRNLLTALAVAAATIVFSAVMVIPYALSSILRQSDNSPRLVVTNKGAVTYGLPESYYAKIVAIDGVVAVSRMTWFAGVYDDPRNQFPTMGLDDNPDEIWPEYGINNATVVAFDRVRSGAVVGIATMHRFGWQVGQRVSLRSQVYPLTLSFIITGTYDKGPDLSGFMFHRSYLEEAMHSPGRADLMWVRCTDYGSTNRVAAAIDETFRNSPAETETSTEKAFMAEFIARFNPIARLVEVIGACAVVAIALAVLNATAMTMRERGSEIAVLQALGFESAGILTTQVLEVATVALVGGLFGVLGSAVILNGIRGYVPALGPLLSFGLPGPMMAAGVAAALSIGLIAGGIPAFFAVRRPVVDSLRHLA